MHIMVEEEERHPEHAAFLIIFPKLAAYQSSPKESQ